MEISTIVMAKSKVMNGVGTCLAQIVVFFLGFREDLLQLVDPSFNFFDFCLILVLK